MIRKIDHFVITTSQIEKCLMFYQALGFHIEEDFGCFVLYAGDFKINVHTKGKERIPHAEHIQCGSGDFCFEIDTSIQACLAELEEKGITSETGIVARCGVKGMMESFYLRDPDGTLIELCSYDTK